MLCAMETPFPCDPVHLQLFFRQLKPRADIAAKLETMKLFSSFFFGGGGKHAYYFGCFCFCLVADVQHRGVMGVVM